MISPQFMQEIEKEIDFDSVRFAAARLRKVGLTILLSGLLLAAFIYAFIPDNTPSDPNSLMTQYYKREETQVQNLWGNGGSLVLGITRSLKHPGTYSAIIVTISVIAALGCFYLSSHPPRRKE